MTNQPKRPAVVAIDGPGASGKSTVGRLVAEKLGYRFVDTGGMYRAITWLALQGELDLDDEASLVTLAETTALAVLPGGRFFVGDQDLTPLLHLPDVDAKVSLVARVPGVRTVMVEAQRKIAGPGGIVMAGRDIGTVVLPEAELKVYLDASVEERARRRFRELSDEGVAISFESVLEDLRVRDEIDQAREASPLRAADDARIIQTDGLTPEEIVGAICGPCRADAATVGSPAPPDSSLRSE